MSLPIVTLEDHIEGDTFSGIPVIGPIIINGSAPGTAAARVQLSLQRVPYKTGAKVLFDSEEVEGSFPITIVDPDTWEFSVPEVSWENFTLPEGKYQGHLQITDISNVRLTTHDVRMEVKPDI